MPWAMYAFIAIGADMDTIADAVKDKLKDKIGLFTTVYEKIGDIKGKHI